MVVWVYEFKFFLVESEKGKGKKKLKCFLDKG